MMLLLLGGSVADAKPDAGTASAEEDDIPAADEPDQFGTDTELESEGSLEDPEAVEVGGPATEDPAEGISGASGGGYHGRAVDEETIDTGPSAEPDESPPSDAFAGDWESPPSQEADAPAEPRQRSEAQSPPAKKKPSAPAESAPSDAGGWYKIAGAAALGIAWLVFMMRRRRTKG